jgi:hypothetical protein
MRGGGLFLGPGGGRLYKKSRVMRALKPGGLRALRAAGETP